MAGNFDDIIRKVLGMPQPYKEPPFGNQLGPMIQDWLQSTAPQQMNEGDMPPITPEQQFARKIAPITPIPNATEQAQPIPIPAPDVIAGDPNAITQYERMHNSPMGIILNNILRRKGIDI
jgi:hypothetical protein